MILKLSMKNKIVYVSSIVLMSIISIVAYLGGGLKMAYSQHYSVPIGEMIGLEDQQPLEDHQPLGDQQPLENQQPWAGLNEIIVNNLESMVHSPKINQKSMPILPFDSGHILSR
jgi:hypothetical protein